MLRLYAFLCLIFFTLTSYAFETERIINFKQQIHVNTDASIDVSEIISVYAAQDKIIHGLKRQLPVSYKDSYGVSHYSNYEIKEILFNGKPAKFRKVRDGDNLNIYIGDKNIVLDPGVYEYTLRYHVNNAVNFLKDADELYWNITGNSWDFPIEKANAEIYLPQSTVIQQYAGYTGPKGSRGNNFEANKVSPNQINFETTQELLADEGLTIAVAWQKGIVIKPTFWESVKMQLQSNQGQVIILEICLLLLIYYFYEWYRHGRDLKKGTIVPLFEPPENLPPADMRYILHMGFDRKTLAAAIVSLATKGSLSIKDDNSEVTLIKKEDKTKLPESEAEVYEKLFADGQSIALTPGNYKTVETTEKSLEYKLDSEYENKYFITNIKYMLFGVLLTLFAFAVAFISLRQNSDAMFMLVWLSFWTMACYALCCKTWNDIQTAYETMSFGKMFAALLSLIFTGIFIIVEITVFFVMPDPALMIMVPLLFLAVMVNVAFYCLLKAPTKAGRKVMDAILGFKMYLGTTERYRLNALNPPEATPQLFEKYLPYAIALGVENQWGRQFSEVLEQAGTKETPYQPSWYSGSAFNASRVSAFPIILAGSLGGALGSISSAGSASGGGGSSGGGGGGGGGGGW